MATATKKSDVIKPKCFGKFVKAGSPICRKCPSAQACKKVN